ncbi:relaxase/mobilization nuclease domain-containing protein [Fibrella arboris]|uniref:relaxase/mobilization nuclease domain-containing protein n=1 Tax=Fibrella arboris TaxID=3242486 RepID=UPI003522BB76
MVIRILTGKDVAGAVRYNEQKVEQGHAERIQIANYPNNEIAQKHHQFRLQLLEQYARLNPGIQKPSVHLAIAFHPTEVLRADQLKVIGEKVMSETGFGKQPYLMYQHHDTQHPHIHIVTVAVDANGNKISDKFIKNRLQKIRRRLETIYELVQAERASLSQEPHRIGEGAGVDPQSTRQTIADKVKKILDTYSFGSVNSFKKYLGSEGITMNTKAGRSQSGITYQHINPEGANNRPIKASSLPSRPTQARLTDLFSNQADRHKRECKTVETLLRKRLATYRTLTEHDYKQSLRQVGIGVQETEGSYLYINSRAKVVVHETELEKDYTRQELLKSFSQMTERKPIGKPESVSQNNQMTDSRAQTTINRTGTQKRQVIRTKGLAIAPIDNTGAKEDTEKKTNKSKVQNQTGGLTEKPIAEEQLQGPIKKNQKKNKQRKIRRM